MMPSRLCIHYVSKSGRPSSGHQIGKDQSSSQFPRRLVPNNVITIGQLHSCPMLERSCLKSCMHYANQEHPDVQAGFRKGRGTKDHISNIHWIIEKARYFPKKIYFCFIDHATALDCVDHKKLWKIVRQEYQTS